MQMEFEDEGRDEPFKRIDEIRYRPKRRDIDEPEPERLEITKAPEMANPAFHSMLHRKMKDLEGIDIPRLQILDKKPEELEEVRTRLHDRIEKGVQYNQMEMTPVDPEKWGEIDKDDVVTADWTSIKEHLKSEGWSIRKLNAKLKELTGEPVNVRNFFYGSNNQRYNMRYSIFEQLQSLTDTKFEFQLIQKERFTLSTESKIIGEINHNDPRLAELMGIIYGDGYLGDKLVTITLNGVREKEYLDYVAKLTKQVFNVNPIIRFRSNDNAADVLMNSTTLVKQIQELGMMIGDKTTNQPPIPEFVKNNYEMGRLFVKGLFDTDGSIHFARDPKAKTIGPVISFTNCNANTTEFFVDFCKKNDIKTSYSIYKPDGKAVVHLASIRSRKGVTKFHDIMDAEKIKAFMKRHNLSRKHLVKRFPYDPENDIYRD